MIRKVTLAGAMVLALSSLVAAASPAAPMLLGQVTFFDPETLLAGGGRSYLGVDIQEVTSERVAALKLKEERGAEVTMVDQESPAGKAGVKEQDVILEFNGARVEGEEQLRRIIRETPPGRNVTLGISRDGQPLSIQVQLGDRQKIFAGKMPKLKDKRALRVPVPDVDVLVPAPMMDLDMRPFDVQVRSFTAVAGLQVDSLTRQLGEYFGVKNGEGVLVRAVEKGSAGEAAGVKAGDVIIKVDDEPIGGRSDWRRAMRTRSGKVNLVLIRDKREANVSLNMPERKKDEQGTIIVVPDLGEIEEAMESAGDAIEREMNSILPQVEESVKVAAARLEPHVKAQMKEFEKTMKELEKRMQEHAKAAEKAAKEWEKI